MNHVIRSVLLGGALAAAGSAAAIVPADVTITSYVSSGLSGPVGIFNAGDGSGRLFVIQQGGALRVIRNNVLLTPPMLTLAAPGGVNPPTTCAETFGGPLANTGFQVGSEQGLLGLAFHPGFASGAHSGEVFVSYSGANGDTIISRYKMANPSADVMSAADLATCTIILRVDQDYSNHNGGNIVFGPDGFLYFGLGDGGSGNDPCNRAQTLNPANLAANDGNDSGCPSDTSFTDPNGDMTPDRPSITRALLGKILRLDVNGTTPAGANGLCGARLGGAANYAIPPANPFAGADPSSGCDEVWSYGMRNPWRWSFDRQTQDLIIGDVGQDQWEEVDLIPAASVANGGMNFGWKICEGTHARGSCTTTCTTVGAVTPIIEYNNTGNGCSATNTTRAGCSVTGGYRYRGPDAVLQGVYFYGDACNGGLRYSENSGGTWSQPFDANTVTGTIGAIYAFGEDETGVLYAASGSTIYRIGAAAPPAAIFSDGFE